MALTRAKSFVPTDRTAAARGCARICWPGRRFRCRLLGSTGPRESRDGVAQIIADAYQLTRRERDVVQHLAVGCSRSEVAKTLGVSPHTVDDHVKRVYVKLDVRSRAELTSRLFFDHHAPRIAEEVSVGGTGWFLR